MSVETTLGTLPTGTAARILRLSSAAPPDVSTRLRHLGFRSGTQVTKLRTGPLGDPSVYRLLGYEACLRRKEADYLSVELGE